MFRRALLLRGCAAAATMLGGVPALVSNPSRAAPRPAVLRLGFSNTFDSQLGAGAATFAKRVNTSCEGRVRVELYPASEAGGDLEMAQDMRAGVFDMVYASSVAFTEIAPALAVFDLPFLFRDIGHARAVLDGDIGRHALTLLEAQGVIGLAWGENGLRHITSGQSPIRSPKDLAGVKIRVPQNEVMLTAFKALGANPKPLGFQALYGALASGEFQAQENPLSTIRNAAFDRVQKYLCLTGHAYSSAAIMVSKRAYDMLDDPDREVMRQAAAEGARASRLAGDASQKDDLAELRRRGMTVVDDVDQAAFVAALAGVQDGFERRFGKAQLDAIRAVGR